MDRVRLVSIFARLHIMLSCALLWGCGESSEATSPPPPPVHAEVVRAVSRTPSVEVTGRVQAERRATLRTEAAGRVIEAPLRAGDQVSTGDVVLRLDLSRSRISVTQARARLAQAEAGLRRARRAREDAEALSAEGAQTKTLLDQARDREAEASARLDEARAGVRAAEANVSEAVLTAPFDGVLADFRVREGEFVSPGTPVAVLVDRSKLEAELLLDPEEGAGVRVGGEVVVRATRDRVFAGRTASVGEVLDPRTSRLPVRVEIDDPEGVLRPGEIVTFEVAVGEARDALVVPESALVRRDGRTLVFVVVDGRAQARSVRVARPLSAQVEVLGGQLAAGDAVIVAGLERVENGGALRIVDDASDRTAEPPAADGT